jgi:hypothetical protein
MILYITNNQFTHKKIKNGFKEIKRQLNYILKNKFKEISNCNDMCFYCYRDKSSNHWWCDNYVCWNCHVQCGVTNSDYNGGGRICHKCNKFMVNVGFKFKTPKKNNVKKWKELKETWENQSVRIDGKRINLYTKKNIVKQSF